MQVRLVGTSKKALWREVAEADQRLIACVLALLLHTDLLFMMIACAAPGRKDTKQ